VFWKKKIGEFKCPRCGTKQHFNDEQSFQRELERPYVTCVECLAPLKLKAEGNIVVSVERIREQIDLDFNVFSQSCGQTFPYKEKSMLDSESKFLKQVIGMLDGSEMMKRGESQIAFGYALEGKSEKSTYWQQRARQEDPFVEDLNRIFAKYPYQVQLITGRWNKTKHLISISKNCFRCGLLFPKSSSKCPFCGYES